MCVHVCACVCVCVCAEPDGYGGEAVRRPRAERCVDEEVAHLPPAASHLRTDDAVLLEADAGLAGPPGRQVQDVAGAWRPVGRSLSRLSWAMLNVP